jgi:hypothetical protein
MEGLAKDVTGSKSISDVINGIDGHKYVISQRH